EARAQPLVDVARAIASVGVKRAEFFRTDGFDPLRNRIHRYPERVPMALALKLIYETNLVRSAVNVDDDVDRFNFGVSVVFLDRFDEIADFSSALIQVFGVFVRVVAVGVDARAGAFVFERVPRVETEPLITGVHVQKHDERALVLGDWRGIGRSDS